MTSSSGSIKALRKRVASLARKAHNRVCCDCPEKAPTWAAFVSTPKQAFAGSRELVAFICFNCAGAHRQLGPMVSGVKSIALDECKSNPLAHLVCICSMLTGNIRVFFLLQSDRDRRGSTFGRAIRE